jgi:rfaE bifunctional protein nucleotidyltransferase chain/domain
MRHANILDMGTNFAARIHTIEQIAEVVRSLRVLKQRIVLTSGAYDILHVGHANYLEKARAFGDFLIVGVDTDEKVRQRKGPDRPIVPQDERLLMLAHLRHVDALVPKGADDPQHHLIKAVRPDVLVISETTGHADDSIQRMQSLCGRVELLEPQAETSTTAQIRRLHIDGIRKYADRAKSDVTAAMERLVQEMMGKG